MTSPATEINHTSPVSSLLVKAVKALACLPLPVLHAVGGCAGRMVYLLSPGMRAKTRANLERAGLYSPRLAWKSAAAAGKAALESAYVWFRNDTHLLACADHRCMTELARETLARQAAGERKGLLILTPHIGCFEMGARAYGATAPITVLYKAPKQPALHHLLKVARTQSGVTPAAADTAGVRALLRALKRGEAVGILPDQVPSDGDGRWADFFGKPAYTMTLPQRLVEKTGARVCLLGVWRRPGGRGWDMVVEEMEELPTPEAINRRIESLIRRHPEQYVWNYNRYKVPGGVTPPDPGAPVAEPSERQAAAVGAVAQTGDGAQPSGVVAPAGSNALAHVPGVAGGRDPISGAPAAGGEEGGRP
ncbi:MAG: lysophospholipid acyltransferase family protein [Lautropia sp.]|nr:lysophospholipid acyltransferase family protein [Lautropia sp.]